MAKVLLIMLLSAATAIAYRIVRSPGGTGWQPNYDGLPYAGMERSYGGSWGGPSLIRSVRNGWGGNTGGLSARSRMNGYGHMRSPNNGWTQNGYGSNKAYSGTFTRSNPESRSSDSTVIDSIDSFAWDGSGFYSNYFQTKGW
ncbi:uncharacterized protein LOC118264937 [Spodoptera frugiperda]|uniref:Uncharacterized protein LOC118264937 n=1 Tax=Spodoptera frugiperda TaxID=7108 RepID=A0A9R0CYA1_SPOFR|nr:uncharacterized protein LOC118264937 [Spodoptera frugiperda]